jgi:hypothetical protein
MLAWKRPANRGQRWRSAAMRPATWCAASPRHAARPRPRGDWPAPRRTAPMPHLVPIVPISAARSSPCPGPHRLPRCASCRRGCGGWSWCRRWPNRTATACRAGCTHRACAHRWRPRWRSCATRWRRCSAWCTSRWSSRQTGSTSSACAARCREVGGGPRRACWPRVSRYAPRCVRANWRPPPV